MIRPFATILLGLAAGLVGGLIGSSVYEANRTESGQTWNGRNREVIDADAFFIDEVEFQ